MNLNFKKKEYPDIFLGMLRIAFESGLLSSDENFLDYVKNRDDIENFYVMDKSVDSEVLAEAYVQMQLVKDSNNVDLAVGEDLDIIGAKVGVFRAPATYAYVSIVLTLERSLDEDLTLPVGLTCVTKNGKTYKTVTEAYFSSGTQSVSVPAFSVLPGVIGKIPAGALSHITTDISNYTNTTINCVNNEPSSGGEDELTDEEFRTYIKQWHKIHQKGNEWAYRNYFNNFSGLDGYRLEPLWNGSGTLKIILDPGSPYLKNKVYNEIQEKVALFDDDLTVVGAEEKIIDVYAIIDVDIDQVTPYNIVDKEDIKSRVKSAIEIYIRGGYKSDNTYYKGLTIGEDFIPHKCSVFLDNEIPELKNINFSYPKSYVKISDEEICIPGNVEVDIL